jgi:Ring finger domain
MGHRNYIRTTIDVSSVVVEHGSFINETTAVDIIPSSNNTIFSNDTNARGNNSMLKNGLQEVTTAISAILGVIFILAMCACMRSTHSPEAERRIRRYKRGGYKRKTPSYYRLKRIGKSLTVQQVARVEKSGQVQLEDVRVETHQSVLNEAGENANEDVSYSSCAAQYEDAKESSTSACSETNNENLVACCCICLEPYVVGDVVAWSNSSNEDCLHVFHKDCIELWLVNPKHKDCPSCRSVILQEVVPDDVSVDSESDEDDVERQGRIESDNGANKDDAQNDLNSSTTSAVYYIMHGLISRANQVKYNLIGQTISFDSDDDGDADRVNCIDYTNNDVEEQLRPELIRNPSTFRRAMSFGDRIFATTFSTTIKRQQQGSELKPVSTTGDSDDDEAVVIRRATTRIITNQKALRTGHMLRRVVSAGPCTPLDDRKRSVDDRGPICTISNSPASNFIDSSPEKVTIPLRRTLSFRQCLYSRDSVNILTERTMVGVEPNFDGTDINAEEDDIILQR